MPNADPTDVASIDAIMTAAYDGISRVPGEKRDWDRERSLFYPGARFGMGRTYAVGWEEADASESENDRSSVRLSTPEGLRA